MSEIRFRLGDSSLIQENSLNQIYVVDPLLVSYSVLGRIQDDSLIVALPSEDSCRVFVPWKGALGEIMLCTSSLPANHHPFQFELEIARGTVGRLTEKFSRWSDVKFSTELKTHIELAQQQFRDAIFLEPKQAVESAKCSVETAIRAMDLLSQEHAEAMTRVTPATYGLIDSAKISAGHAHVSESGDTVTMIKDGWESVDPEDVRLFSIRVLPTPELETVLACDAIDEARDKSSKTLESINQNLPHRFGIGPILNWRDRKIDKSFADVQDFQLTRQDVYALSKATCETLPDEIQKIFVSSSIGKRGGRFADQEQLQLTLDAMYAIHETRPGIPLMVSFMHPIGNGQKSRLPVVSPLHGADALLRAEVGLRHLALELSFAPRSRLYKRDILQVEEMIDVWSQFLLPISIILELPFEFARNLIQRRDEDDAGSHDLSQLIFLLRSRPEVDTIFFTSGLTPATDARLAPDDLFAKSINQYLFDRETRHEPGHVVNRT